MVATSELERAINDRLAERDLRFTAARRAIVDGLKAADGPITLLEEAEVVRRLAHGSEHAHFELVESLTEHHHHLICESCGLVRDITLAAKLERTLDDQFNALAEAEGFTQTHHTVDVYGLCSTCR